MFLLKHRIVKSEQEERCRAIRDTGNYRLSDRYLHHRTGVSFWSTMTEENRQKSSVCFLLRRGRSDICQTVAKPTPTLWFREITSYLIHHISPHKNTI